MATEATGRTAVSTATSDPMAGLAALAQTLGGKNTTSNPGDVAALQQAIAGLQGQDNEALLQSIFQQASQQMPGLQSSMGRALGARSKNNSALATALQNLLKDTTVTAQDQLVKQQLANLQAQVQAGTSVANATKGTKVTESTNMGAAAKNLAILTALNKLMGKQDSSIIDNIKNAYSSITGATGGDVAIPDASSTPAIDLTGFNTPQAAASFMTSPMGAGYTPVEGGDPTAGGYMPQAAPQYTDMTGFNTPQTQPDWAVSEPVDMTGFISPNQSTNFLSEPTAAPWEPSFADTYDDIYTFADGGLVKKAKGYADGGTVRAGGSRRSANPTVNLVNPLQTQANVASQVLAGMAGNTGSAAPVAPVVPRGPAAPAAPAATRVAPNLFNNTAGSGGGSYDFSGANVGDLSGVTNRDIATGLGKAATANSLLGMTTGIGIPGFSQIAGPLAGFIGAETPEDKAKSLGLSALNAALPGSVAAINTAMNPTMTNVANLGLSAGVPGYAALSAGLGLFGLASPAEIAQNAYQLANPNQMMTPTQEATVKAEQAAAEQAAVDAAAKAEAAAQADAAARAAVEARIPSIFGGGGYGSVTQGNLDTANATSDPLGSLIGQMDWSGGGGFESGGDGSGNGSYGGGGMSGESQSGSQAGGGEADGGPIKGPGTGISDSIKARLSDGEFVISADVVEKLGEDFFNQLQAAFHTPAAVQKRGR